MNMESPFLLRSTKSSWTSRCEQAAALERSQDQHSREAPEQAPEAHPFFTIQGHVVYSFRPGLWIAGGLGYGLGQESTVDGDNKDDQKRNVVWGLSVGYPITRSFGVKVRYLGRRAQADTGIDSDSFSVGASYFW